MGALSRKLCQGSSVKEALGYTDIEELMNLGFFGGRTLEKRAEAKTLGGCMEEAVIVSGGEGPLRPFPLDRLVQDRLVIAADSGLDLLISHGLRPHYLVGDMDSLQYSDYGQMESQGIVVRKYPQDKDETDTEIALALADELRVSRIMLVGGGGGRLDHLMNIVNNFQKSPGVLEWFTAREWIHKVIVPVELTSRGNETLSIVPLGRGPWKIKSMGLAWELDQVDFEQRYSISNVAVGTEFRLLPESGHFMLIRSLEAWNA